MIKKRRFLALASAMILAVSGIPTNFISVKAAQPETQLTQNLESKSASNAQVWDATALLAAVEKEDNGLMLAGGWGELKEDGGAADKIGVSTYTQATGNPSAVEGKVPTGGAYMKYTATADGKLTVAMKTNKGKRSYIVDSKDNELMKIAADAAASSYDKVTVDVVKGETYYVYTAGSKICLFEVTFLQNAGLSWVGNDLLNAMDKEENGLTIVGSDWTLKQEGAPVENLGGLTDYIQSNTSPVVQAGSVPTGGAYMQYTAAEDGKLAIYMKTNKTKTSYIVDSKGTTIKEITAGAVSSYDIVTIDVVANETYYVYTAGSKICLFKVEFSKPQKVTDWNLVAAPVINEVKVDAEGNFEVALTSIIDPYNGAENVQVTMFYNGFEVTTQNLKVQVDKVKFTPMWSGNYTFKAVAQRTGEPDKASETVPYNDYVLAVKKPVIELAQNRGNGVVYLDWVNITDANSFSVSYKAHDVQEYTVAEAANTTGNATISGLTAGTAYDFKIVAKRNSDGFESTYVKENFTVTQEASQDWFFTTVGSAQQTIATVKDEQGTEIQKVNLSSQDATEVKVGLEAAKSIANTKGTVTFAATDNGKISDGEEGFQYYYTMINPNTDNFEMTATFKITDTSLTPDNQSGFGIIASDMLGYNFWGTPDYVHKLFNNVSTQMYSSKGKFIGLRAITGYESIDTTSFDGVERKTEQQKFSNTNADFTEGQTYTFTLKKTDDAWISICNGEEKRYENLAALSVQEDGSICIGVFSARKVGVEVSDITFTMSESKGVGEAAVKEKVKPNVMVASSGTANSSNYTYICTPNVDGTLKVYAPDGTLAETKEMKADEVARVSVLVKQGTNTIKSEFIPDTKQDLANYDTITNNSTVDYKVVGNIASILYVSPDGKADAAGTKEAPMDIYTVVKYAQPGQYIMMLNGTYKGGDIKIERSVSGTENKHIKLVAEDVNKVILEGCGLNITGSYWDIYGIYVKKPSAVGIQICGNYNTIDMCTVEGSANTGVQISRGGSANNIAGIQGLLWPSYNLIKNCESFDNCDAGRNDADGFAAKLTCGEGNVFYGCISHNNIDDGWDLFAKTISGEIGSVTIENCVAYNNGWLTYEGKDDPKLCGEGNGFKLGGSYMKGGHVLKNSISYGNLAKGITSNSCPDCEIYNCISYGNAVDSEAVYNVGLNTKDSNLKEWIVDGLISVTTTANTTTPDLIPFSLSTETNFIYNGQISRNSAGVVVTDDWFKSVDITKAPTRNANGTINMDGLLELTDKAPANTGARLDTTSDKAISTKPVMEEVSFELGDVNCDGEIDVRDGIIIKRYLAKFEGIIINQETSDMNHDGVINSQDAVLVMKKIAGMAI